MGYFYDATYILVIIGALLGLLAQAKVKGAFARYSKVYSMRGVTAEQVAEMILQQAGIRDVRIEQIGGDLTDHYSPNEKVLRLSETVYGSSSVAAIGVAAHECGHAIQHAEDYLPIQIRSAIVPVVNIGSKLAWPIIFLGLLIGMTPLANVGIILFSLIVVFQVVTLPVEFNASGRALAILRDSSYLSGDELKGARKVLSAAAMTYVAAMVASVLQLLRLVMIVGRRRD